MEPVDDGVPMMAVLAKRMVIPAYDHNTVSPDHRH